MKVENNPFEPIENLLVRNNIPVANLKGRTWTTCNISYDGELDVICYPLAWAHEVKGRIINKKYIHNNNKKFITLVWAYNKCKEDWYQFIKDYLNNGYYNFNYKKLSNLKYNVRWETLPQEYYDCTWEFGIESGTNKPFNCITEKTYRPLMLEKPFLVYGPPGMYKKLKDLGFTLNPNIDYSFDKDSKLRWKRFCKEVKRLMHDNVDKHISHAKINRKEFDKIVLKTRNDFERFITYV